MGKRKKAWTPQEKQAIVKYFKENGIGVTCRHFNVSAPSVYKWDRELNQDDSKAFSGNRSTKLESDFKRLEKENKELKAIVAEKELELRIKTEMLKKSK